MNSNNFKIKGIQPGVVITKKHGQIDFSKDVPETALEDLHQNGFPYLEKIDKPEVKIHKQKDSPE